MDVPARMCTPLPLRMKQLVKGPVMESARCRCEPWGSHWREATGLLQPPEAEELGTRLSV